MTYTDDRDLTTRTDPKFEADVAARREQRRNARRAKLGADGIIASALRTASPRRAVS